MKKWTSLLLALAMALSLAACGSSFPGRLRQFQSGKHPGASGICQRLHWGRNACPHRHGNARRGAIGGTGRE